MTDWNEELFEAVKNSDVVRAGNALDNGADVNAKDKDEWSALHWSASLNHSHIIPVLISRGADIEIKCRGNCTPLVLAVERNSPWVVEVLLTLGANLYAKSSQGTALERAQAWGHVEIIEMLEKAMVKKEKPKPETPLERLRRQRRESPIEENFWGLS